MKPWPSELVPAEVAEAAEPETSRACRAGGRRVLKSDTPAELVEAAQPADAERGGSPRRGGRCPSEGVDASDGSAGARPPSSTSLPRHRPAICADDRGARFSAIGSVAAWTFAFDSRSLGRWASTRASIARYSAL